MRVCLINPPRIQPKSWGKPCVFQPLDVAYVAAVLEKEQHLVSIIDAPTEGWQNLVSMDSTKYRLGLSSEDIAERIRSWHPDLVGISVPFSGWWKTAFEVASTVKSVDKEITTALFGLHPSVRPVDCLMKPGVNFVIIGEPECTMQELVGNIEKKVPDLSQTCGIAFLKNGAPVFGPPRSTIKNLDSLPFPARHLLPMNAYFEAVKKCPVRGEIHKKWARIITSRGCPHSCIFCSNRVVWGNKWRPRSPENVVAEIEYLVNSYGIKQLDFDDDNLTHDKKRMVAICDLIVQKGLKIEWYTPNGVRADSLDEELLAKMRLSGCERILIAPESGVQRIVDEVIRKNQDLRKVEQAVVLARKVGIKVGCFFMMGLIGETKEDIMETIDFASKLRQLGADRFYFSIATPLYGTPLFEQAKESGFLKANFSDEALSAAEPLIETSEFTASDLRSLCAQANLINPTLTRDRLRRALLDPRKAARVMIGKTKAIYRGRKK